MLRSLKPLGIAVSTIEELNGKQKYRRVCTQEEIDGELGENDVVTSSSESNDYELVYSLKSIKRKYAIELFITRIMCPTFTALAIYSVYYASKLFGFESDFWKHMFVPACFFTLAVLYFPQMLNPRLSDRFGKWINLATGYSNLNGGMKIT